MLHYFIAFLYGVMVVFGTSVVKAEQDFERKPTLVAKHYISGELVSLRCGEERKDCELKIKTRLHEVSLTVPFAAHGYVPNLNQIMMYVRDDAEALVTIRTDVECTAPQLEWADKIDAFRLSCILILNINNGIIEDWFSEAIPSLQPKAGIRSKN